MQTQDTTHRRRIYYVHEYQRSFISHFCLATFGAMVATSLVLLILFSLVDRLGWQTSLQLLIGVNCVVLFALLLLTAVLALRISHRVGGPLYRLERVMGEMAQGRLDQNIRLREGDQLQSLAQAVNQVCQALSRSLQEVKNQVADLKDAASREGSPRLQEKVAELETLLKRRFVF
jgi:methyl-accepting chemotaxis protein